MKNPQQLFPLLLHLTPVPFIVIEQLHPDREDLSFRIIEGNVRGDFSSHEDDVVGRREIRVVSQDQVGLGVFLSRFVFGEWGEEDSGRGRNGFSDVGRRR